MAPLHSGVGGMPAPIPGFRATLIHAKTTFLGAADTVGNVLENLRILPAPRIPDDPLVGKVCVVTGGNTGIGLATAEVLANRGAHVVLACRSRERGAAAVATLRDNCKLLPGCGSSPSVEVMQVDLASLESVRAFCAAFALRDVPLHLLVANGGLMSPATRLQTTDGLEMQFQVNFLSHWLMAQLLLKGQGARQARLGSKPARAHTSKAFPHSSSPVVTKSPAEGKWAGWGLADDCTRVVMLSSLTHHAGCLNWQDMQSQQTYDPFTSYALSKLCNTMTAVELQRHFGREHVRDTAVAVHPGVVDTELSKGFFKAQGMVQLQPLVAWAVEGVAPWLLKSRANSALCVAVAALAPAKQVAGKYLSNGRVVAAAVEAEDADLADQLWASAQQLTNTVPA